MANYGAPMACSRAVRVASAALLGSVGWGWYAGGHPPATYTATIVEAVDGDTVVAQFERDAELRDIYGRLFLANMPARRDGHVLARARPGSQPDSAAQRSVAVPWVS